MTWGSHLIKVLSWHLPEETAKKSWYTSVRVVGALAKILTKYLLNTNLQHSSYSSLPGDTMWSGWYLLKLWWNTGKYTLDHMMSYPKRQNLSYHHCQNLKFHIVLMVYDTYIRQQQSILLCWSFSPQNPVLWSGKAHTNAMAPCCTYL